MFRNGIWIVNVQKGPKVIMDYCELLISFHSIGAVSISCNFTLMTNTWSFRTSEIHDENKQTFREHSFFRTGGGLVEFRGGSLTFCLPKKGVSP